MVIPAFIAGVLTFLAPCTLPILPAYLGFISGVSLNNLKDREVNAARRRIFLNGLFYVLGFSAVFIVLGTVFGLAGYALARYRIWLVRIAGIFVIVFGLHLAGAAKIPFLSAEKKFFGNNSFFKPGRPVSSFLLGSAFALGWTPCVGPILGSILLLASTATTAFQGTLLLSVFSAGLAIPYLLVALGAGSVSSYINKISPYLGFVEVIGGLFLIAVGFLLLTNQFSIWISFAYKIFNFINYGRLLNYL